MTRWTFLMIYWGSTLQTYSRANRLPMQCVCGEVLLRTPLAQPHTPRGLPSAKAKLAIGNAAATAPGRVGRPWQSQP